MKENTRSLGKAITIMFIIFTLILGLATSCTVYKQPKPKPLHVLVVTTEGDTLKLPIGVIRPIYNYNNITYPQRYYPNYYYPNYNFIHSNKPVNNNNNNNVNNNNSSNNTISRPSNATENLNLRKNND
jgi:hypothetical protein